ncbi:phage major capsid protein [Microvirga sp. 17 mud 1-3]|uniref:phage major capsid protein n=1 Tax=Microvirga sp. 17 mud 1-3 TaxID=2082949 RepID=UPI000D6C18E4|nr:phage major capsid protein [Microvirga sp. 17 mud 1-3]AWM87368.1 phage major capsid protein [Microvirga sp. 17 mud 1-3]
MNEKELAKRLKEIRERGLMQREASVVGVDLNARTVELSFSSEEEYRRWFGIEVLDHSPGAVRLDRLNDGAAVLWNHNWNDQRGVVESARIDKDRKGRAVVRFSKSEDGEEMLQDIADGIITKVSVGYQVHGIKLKESKDDADVYLVTDWEPYEISMVSVPADATVGVGRAAEIPQEEMPASAADNGTIRNSEPANNPTPKGRNMHEKIMRDAQGNLVRAKVDDAGAIQEIIEVIERAGDGERSHVQRGADAERNRVRSITELGTQYDQRDLAMEFIGNGKSPEEFQRALLDKMNERSAKPIKDAPSASLGMSDREVRNFSVFRAVRALLPNASQADRDAAAFEFECSRAAEKQYGKEAQGILIPQDVLDRAFNAGGAANTPTGATSGANVVATELLAGSFIEMLRKRTTIMRLAQTMGGLVGNIEVPKQTGGATAYWVGEGADAIEGTPVIGQIAMTPKTVAAYTDITRRLLMQSTPDAEGIVRRDLIAAVSQAIDLAGYYGSGAGNEPRGIKNYTGINAVDLAGASPTYAEVVQMESEIAADNADVDSMAYVVNAIMRGALKTTQKFTGTNGAPVWEPGNTLNGYRAEVTNQLANGDAFFGNFADLIVGLWGGLDLTVDPYSLSKSGGTRIVVFQDVDFALRRLESFCYASASVVP